MDVAAPPQRGQVQRTVRIEYRIDEGSNGAGHGAATSHGTSEPVADFSRPITFRSTQGDTEHPHEGRRRAVRTGLTHGPGERTPLAPALDDDLIDEDPGVAALISAGG